MSIFNEEEGIRIIKEYLFKEPKVSILPID